MAVPQVVCNADVVLSYSASPQSVVLGALAAPSPITGWRWTILSVPPGSQAHAGSKGSFTDGVATVQNPTLLCDGGVDGGYTIQCVATNADGNSDPFTDRRDAQQAVIVRTQAHQIWLPGDYLFDWGEKYLNPTLRRLESLVGSGGGGEEPFWEWNGEDLSEFEVYVGSQVSDYSVDRILLGGMPWIELSIQVGCGGGNFQDWTVGLLAEGVVPPSANYYLVADVLFEEETFTRALLGVRVTQVGMKGAAYTGYMAGINFEPGNGDGAENRIWALRESYVESMLRQQLERSPRWYADISPPFGGTYRVGAEGDAETDVLVHFSGRDEMHALDKGGKYPAIVAAGSPFIGAFGFIGSYNNVLIGNIRAYEYRARAGAGTGSDSDWPGIE